MNDHYSRAFDEAMTRTREWGLEVPDFHGGGELPGPDEIRDAIFYFAGEKEWVFPYDLAGKCINRHLEIKGWLEFALGLESRLSVGTVLVNGKPRYDVDLDVLRWELDNPATEPRTFLGHVWLTLPNFSIVDVVLPASLCYEELNRRGKPPKH